MLDDDIYSPCSEKETFQHLFFECTKVKFVWIYVLNWIQLPHAPSRWIDELDWFQHMSRGKVGRLAYSKLPLLKPYTSVAI